MFYSSSSSTSDRPMGRLIHERSRMWISSLQFPVPSAALWCQGRGERLSGLLSNSNAPSSVGGGGGRTKMALFPSNCVAPCLECWEAKTREGWTRISFYAMSPNLPEHRLIFGCGRKGFCIFPSAAEKKSFLSSKTEFLM